MIKKAKGEKLTRKPTPQKDRDKKNRRERKR